MFSPAVKMLKKLVAIAFKNKWAGVQMKVRVRVRLYKLVVIDLPK